MSSVTLMLAAAKPWTYWMWPPLLALGVVAVLAVVAGYYRKVMVPRYQWPPYEAQLQLRSVRPLTRRPRPTELEFEKAA